MVLKKTAFFKATSLHRLVLKKTAFSKATSLHRLVLKKTAFFKATPASSINSVYLINISILHPTTCGFARIIAYELINLQLPLEKQIEKYNIVFEQCQEKFQVTLDTYKRNFPKIVAKMPSNWKTPKRVETYFACRILNQVLGGFVIFGEKKTLFIKL